MAVFTFEEAVGQQDKQPRTFSFEEAVGGAVPPQPSPSPKTFSFEDAVGSSAPATLNQSLGTDAAMRQRVVELAQRNPGFADAPSFFIDQTRQTLGLPSFEESNAATSAQAEVDRMGAVGRASQAFGGSAMNTAQFLAHQVTGDDQQAANTALQQAIVREDPIVGRGAQFLGGAADPAFVAAFGPASGLVRAGAARFAPGIAKAAAGAGIKGFAAREGLDAVAGALIDAPLGYAQGGVEQAVQDTALGAAGGAVLGSALRGFGIPHALRQRRVAERARNIGEIRGQRQAADRAIVEQNFSDAGDPASQEMARNDLLERLYGPSEPRLTPAEMEARAADLTAQEADRLGRTVSMPREDIPRPMTAADEAAAWQSMANRRSTPTEQPLPLDPADDLRLMDERDPDIMAEQVRPRPGMEQVTRFRQRASQAQPTQPLPAALQQRSLPRPPEPDTLIDGVPAFNDRDAAQRYADSLNASRVEGDPPSEVQGSGGVVPYIVTNAETDIGRLGPPRTTPLSDMPVARQGGRAQGPADAPGRVPQGLRRPPTQTERFLDRQRQAEAMRSRPQTPLPAALQRPKPANAVPTPEPAMMPEGRLARPSREGESPTIQRQPRSAEAAPLLTTDPASGGAFTRAARDEFLARPDIRDEVDAMVENGIARREAEAMVLRDAPDIEANAGPLSGTSTVRRSRSREGGFVNVEPVTRAAQAAGREVAELGKGVAERAGQLRRGARDALVPVSSRISDIDPVLGNRLRSYDQRVAEQTHKYKEKADAFFRSKRGLGTETSKQLDRMLLNGQFAEARRLIQSKGGNKSGDILKQFDEVRGVLDELFERSRAAGFEVNRLPDFWPRRVKSYDEFVQKLGREPKGPIDDAIKLEEKRLGGRPLTDEEATKVANAALAGRGPRTPDAGAPRQFRERRVDQIDDTVADQYLTPEESLLGYIEDTTKAIERRRFFGSKGVNPDDVAGSIGDLSNRLRATGKIDAVQQRELQKLLESRFVKGEQGVGPLTSGVKQATYTALLGNPVSAITQLGDVALATYKNAVDDGVLNALADTIAAMGQRKVTARDMGLQHLAEEFRGKRSAAKWVMDKSFKYSGFEAVDIFGKNVALNSSLRQAQRFARNADKPRAKAWIDKQRKVFGDQTDSLMKDLREGKVSENVKLLAWNRLADMQPISLSEMPKTYLDMKNGRILYMLKTFTVKQLDIMRRNIIKEAAEGNVGKAARNAALYIGLMGAAGVTTDVMKDLVTGKEPELADAVVDNLLGMVGLNKYATGQISRGQFTEFVGGMAFAPAGVAGGAIQGRGIRYIPMVGRMIEQAFKEDEKPKGLKLNLKL